MKWLLQHWHIRQAWRGFGLLFASLCLWSPNTAWAEEILPVEVVVNGTSKGGIFVTSDNGDVLMERGDYDRLGVGVPANSNPVSLNAMSSVLTYRFEPSTAQLVVDVRPELLPNSTINVTKPYDPELPPSTRPRYQKPSLVVNYAASVIGGSQLEDPVVSVPVDVAARARGYLFEGGLSWDSESTEVRRGYTRVTVDDVDTRQRYIFGDTNIATSRLGTGGAFAGVTVTSSQELTPGLRQINSQAVTGLIETPSEIELYVDDRLVERRRLPAGPFAVTNFPSNYSGSTATIVVRDAFGTERRFSNLLFGSTELLADGEHDYTYLAGVSRTDTDDYDDDNPVLVGHHRYGVSQRLTAGARLEASQERISGGVEATYQLSQRHTVRAELAASTSLDDDDLTDFAGVLGFSYAGDSFVLNAQYLEQGKNYKHVTSLEEEQQLARTAVLSMSFPMADWLSFNSSVQYRENHDRSSELNARVGLDFSLSSNTTLRVFGNYTEDENGESDQAIGIDIRHRFDNGIRLGGDIAYNEDGELETGVSVAGDSVTGEEGELSPWSVSLDRIDGDLGEVYRANASVGKTNEYGEATLNVIADQDGNTSYSARVASSVAFVDGSTVVGPPITSGFAVVRLKDTPPGGPGVEVRRGGSVVVGTLDGEGTVAIRNLGAYRAEKIVVDVGDEAFEYGIDQREHVVAVAPRGADVIDVSVFKKSFVEGLVYVRIDGKKIFLETSAVKLSGPVGDKETAIGFAGLLFLEDYPPGRYTGESFHLKSKCTFAFDLPRTEETFVDLGEIECHVK